MENNVNNNLTGADADEMFCLQMDVRNSTSELIENLSYLNAKDRAEAIEFAIKMLNEAK